MKKCTLNTVYKMIIVCLWSNVPWRMSSEQSDKCCHVCFKKQAFSFSNKKGSDVLTRHLAHADCQLCFLKRIRPNKDQMILEGWKTNCDWTVWRVAKQREAEYSCAATKARGTKPKATRLFIRFTYLEAALPSYQGFQLLTEGTDKSACELPRRGNVLSTW